MDPKSIHIRPKMLEIQIDVDSIRRVAVLLESEQGWILSIDYRTVPLAEFVPRVVCLRASHDN